MKITKCKYCQSTFDLSEHPKGWMANHSRWCHFNPKRSEYANGSVNAIRAMNESRTKTGKLNQYSKAKIEGKEIPISTQKGKTNFHWLGKKHSEKTKSIIKEKALASKHRRLQRNIIEYKGILLDSTWELALAKRLDELDVKWIRPDPIIWIDKEGVSHNYFADFYLPEQNLYLDPKNPAAIRVQKEKIKCLLTQYNNIVIIDTLEKCTNYRIERE